MPRHGDKRVVKSCAVVVPFLSRFKINVHTVFSMFPRGGGYIPIAYNMNMAPRVVVFLLLLLLLFSGADLKV